MSPEAAAKAWSPTPDTATSGAAGDVEPASEGFNVARLTWLLASNTITVTIKTSVAYAHCCPPGKGDELLAELTGFPRSPLAATAGTSAHTSMLELFPDSGAEVAGALALVTGLLAAVLAGAVLAGALG